MTTLFRTNAMTKRTTISRSLVIALALSTAGCGNSTQEQAFYDALMSEDQQRISEIVAQGADVNTSRLDGFLPLHFSIANKAEASVDWLLAHGADVESKDGGGNTPLLWAVSMKNDRVIDILLRAGADPCGAGKGGKTPRQMAQAYADAKVLARLGPCKGGA
jgi:ankyrin repeat protein